MRLRRLFRPHAAGTVAVETAILAPLYMILLFAVIFFGYSTLAKQKEQTAAHFIAMQPGEQRASDMVGMFFPWNGDPEGEVSAMDGDATGSEVVAGDALIRVLEVQSEPDVYAPTTHSPPAGGAGLGDTFDPPRLLEYLWVMAVGELTNVISMDMDGNVTTRVVDHRDYKARYLQDEHVIDPAPPAGPAWNLRNSGAAYALNNVQDQPWVNRRYARVEYEYTPPFFRHVYGKGERTSPYLALEHPEPTYVPNYTNESRIITRGAGERANTIVHGYGTVVSDMSRLLGDGRAMPQPMTDADLAGLYPADAGSAWIAK